MRTARNDDERSGHRKFLVFLYTISLLIIAFFLINGYSYYLTDYGKRPRLPEYGELKPSGDFGHAFGIIGSTLMIFMLLYSIRKRTRILGKIGKLRNWLDIHIYCGIIGPLLIILHTSFKVQGLVMVSFWSMMAVALSGVFGRYLYLQIPRDVQGENISMQDLNAISEQLTSQMSGELSLTPEQMAAVERQFTTKVSESRGLIRSLLTIVIDDIVRPFKIRRARKKFSRVFSISREVLDDIIDLALRKTLLKRKMVVLDQVQQLFHYWHVFHKPFAIIMYMIMAVHVGVAIWLGYVWVF